MGKHKKEPNKADRRAVSDNRLKGLVVDSMNERLYKTPDSHETVEEFLARGGKITVLPKK